MMRWIFAVALVCIIAENVYAQSNSLRLKVPNPKYKPTSLNPANDKKHKALLWNNYINKNFLLLPKQKDDINSYSTYTNFSFLDSTNIKLNYNKYSGAEPVNRNETQFLIS